MRLSYGDKMNINQLIPFTALIILSGCNNLGQHETQPKAISYDDASAYERSLLMLESTQSEPAKLYTQPINKKTPCKVPTTQNQLERPNFRAYWDGDCKNGFAFGLGRDIAISDTHHLEEITIHDGNGGNWSGPRVNYDYVNNSVIYAVGGARFPASTLVQDRIINTDKGFNETITLGVIDESGKTFSIQTSPFSPQRQYINSNIHNPIAFRFTDNSSAPVINQNAVSLTAEIVDRRTNTIGGVAIARYANGSVRHFKIINGRPELTLLPSSYIEHLIDKYQEIQNTTAKAATVLQQAEQIEREYLFKACNGKNHITGLDKKTYTEICVWRDKFKEPYATALSNYQKQLENMRLQASSAERQLQIQQEMALQQRKEDLREQEINLINTQLQQMRNSGSQQQQIINSYQIPKTIPITPVGGNRVTCVNTGIVTNCKY